MPFFRRSRNNHAKLFIISLIIVSAALILPQGALAYSTYLKVAANDYENSELPDYAVEYTNELTATATVSYSGRTDKYGRPLSAYAYGEFNMSAGLVKFKIQAQGGDAEASANIYITEQIYPQWEMPGGDGIMNIQLSWQMDGVYEPNGGLKNLGLSSVCGWGIDEAASPGSLSQYNLTDGTETWIQNVQFNPATDTYLEIGVWINAWIQPYSQIATADFSNTGYIGVLMPEGASFASSSGAFLRGSPVPVPAAFWLLGSGLAGLIALRRKVRP